MTQKRTTPEPKVSRTEFVKLLGAGYTRQP